VEIESRPLAGIVRDSMATAVTAGRGAWWVGGLALALALAGTIGVFGYVVEERRREIGICMALGARPERIVFLALGAASRAFILGLAGGAILSWMTLPVLRRFLFGLDPADPVAYLQTALILAVVAGVAAWVPARRATSIDPATTLRCE
jgi:ABC-type antimicrobial peptide transport system permease subunit